MTAITQVLQETVNKHVIENIMGIKMTDPIPVSLAAKDFQHSTLNNDNQ